MKSSKNEKNEKNAKGLWFPAEECIITTEGTMATIWHEIKINFKTCMAGVTLLVIGQILLFILL